ncbi:MAG TPA: DUF3568 family protein [Gemmatimonadaceae bacterium]|nr:DUF3568 family protein [Gemmatimonadaceae bacterium]
MRKWSTGAARGALFAMLLTLPGCLLAAAGAGAGAGIFLTTRGASSLVNASVEDVAARTRAVFEEMNITVLKSSEERGGDKREVSGQRGDMEVDVSMERKSPTTTDVEVTAKRNVADYDKDFAKSVLSRIIEHQ